MAPIPEPACPTRAIREGERAGVQGASSRAGSDFGSTSKSSIPMSTAEMPSAIAWWVL